MSKQVMDKVFDLLDQIAKLGNGQHYGNSIGNTLALDAIDALKEAIKQHDAEPIFAGDERRHVICICPDCIASPQPTKGDA